MVTKLTCICFPIVDVLCHGCHALRLVGNLVFPDRFEGGRLGGVARQGQGFLDNAHQEPRHFHLPQLLSQLGWHADLLGEAAEQHLRYLPAGDHQGLATVFAAL